MVFVMNLTIIQCHFYIIRYLNFEKIYNKGHLQMKSEVHQSNSGEIKESIRFAQSKDITLFCVNTALSFLLY